MKIPKRVIGFLELNNTKFPFEFDKNTFELKLYFPTENDAYEQIFSGLSSYRSNLKEHKWINRITINGRTAERYLVYFGTSDDPSIYNGYRIYNVDWYYVTDNEGEFIDEIRFYGREIDYFYNPTIIFQQIVKYKEEKYISVESLSVHTVDIEDLRCGTYMSNGVQVDVSCCSTAKMNYQSTSPLDSKSFLKLRFSEKINLDELINKARIIQNLIKYVSYRTNNVFSDISTYIVVEDDKVRNCGKLIFNTHVKEEQNEKAKERIIKAEDLNEHVSYLLKVIESGEMAFGHYCNSIEDTRHYPISRIIMILAAFEREFRNVYGQDVRRSEDYKETKTEIVDLIMKYAENMTGKRKKYIKKFAKGIMNTDSSYGDNLKYAFEDCKIIMEPFVIKHFNGTYEEIIEDVSLNINDLRNGVAHSRLDMKLEARHLTDIHLVEEMLYVIRLKSIGVDKTRIKKIVNELFGENMAL